MTPHCQVPSSPGPSSGGRFAPGARKPRLLHRSARASIVAFLVSLACHEPAAARIGYGVASIDDASTLWAQTWEIKLGLEAGANYRLEGSDVTAVRVPTQIRYGWRERLEWGFLLPFLYQQTDNNKFDGSGIGDIAIALKYQMTQDEENYPATATEVRLGYGAGTATASDALSIAINYAVSKSFGERGVAHGNLGYTFFTADRQDVLSWGAAYDYRFLETLRGFLGVNSGSQMMPGVRNDIIAELGVTRQAGPSLEYQLAAGIGLNKNSPDWQVRFGFTKELGRGAGEATNFRRAEWSHPPAPGAAEIVARGENAARTGDYTLAISYYREAITIDSSLPSAWNNMGIAYFKLGRTTEAMEAYENAAKLAPDNADIYFNMGLAHYKLGDIYAARRAFARALELNPEHGQARSNLLSLEGRTGAR